MAKIVTCNRCSVPDLHWNQVDGKWKLFDANNNPHACSAPNKLQPNTPSNGGYKKPWQKFPPRKDTNPELIEAIKVLTAEISELRKLLTTKPELQGDLFPNIPRS